MALAPGSRLGHYDVTDLLGEGGMGQVWQATDTQLNRQVALKILPDAFAADPDRLARFTREAQILASLNHPNIAAIHGIEEAEGTRALVLELVEGPTLADRIAKGPIPLDEALPIAKQIAEALEAAHEAGVIHRDLKPANIKVREDGTVKVLDFGLAKALDPNPEGDPSQSPTLTAAATQMGVIMGTAAYMSPEQARGKPVDKRADIWAFGCVLYEMLTGQRAFQGEDVSLTLAEVMKSEPNWTALPADTPAAIRRLLDRAMAKERTKRLQHVGDARIEIDEALIHGDTDVATELSVSRLSGRSAAGLLVGAVLVLAAGLIGWQAGLSQSATPPPQHRVSIDLPESTVLPQGIGTSIAISPDGQYLVFVGHGPGGRQLYLHRMDEFGATPIPGTTGASMPFLSRDGQWVGFEMGVSLVRVPMSGGEPFTLCSPCNYGFWGEDGNLIFSWDGTVWQVPVGG